jgi:hypothetical protein
MKRRRLLLKLGLLVLAGAIVNVALAWGFAVFVNPFSVEAESGTLYDRGNWRVSRWLRAGSLAVHVQKHHNTEDVPSWSQYADDGNPLVPSWSDIIVCTHEFDTRQAWVEDRFIRGHGWPAVSMWGEVGSSIMVDMNEKHLPTRSAIELPAPWGYRGVAKPRIIPLKPIWPGFAINTIFYAAMLWLLFVTPGAARRWRRRRRGLCPNCAYPVGQSPTCTECGYTLKMPESKAAGS